MLRKIPLTDGLRYPGATRTSKAIKEAALEANSRVPRRASTTQEAYVLMNIPYADFYAAEGDADVDAVSSATKMKTKSIACSRFLSCKQ